MKQICILSFKLTIRNMIFFTYLKQVIIKREWPEMIDRLYENMYYGDFAGILKEFAKEYADKEYELENIITYFYELEEI